MLGSKPSSTAPRSADADAGELEALIEEARQRARRRRRRYLTAVGLAVVTGAGVYFGLLRDDDGTESSVGAPESQAPGGSLQSGVVEGSVDMGMTGLEGGGSRQRISFSGPFITRTTARLPEFDLAFRMSEPGETPVAFSLISTTEAGYVVYRDSAYQVDSALFERLSSAPVLAELDPARWANAPGVNATKKVAGKNASRKSGRLDVGRMVSDITGAP